MLTDITKNFELEQIEILATMSRHLVGYFGCTGEISYSLDGEVDEVWIDDIWWDTPDARLPVGESIHDVAIDSGLRAAAMDWGYDNAPSKADIKSMCEESKFGVEEV